MQALERNPHAKLVAVVHAETSTGVRNPVHELGAALKGSDAMLLVDCVTSLGGIEVDVDGWGIDDAFSCTQKCIGAPPGMSPISISDRARQRVRERRREPPFYFDLELLERYWVERPAGAQLRAPIHDRGLELLSEPGYELPQLTAVRVIPRPSPVTPSHSPIPIRIYGRVY